MHNHDISPILRAIPDTKHTCLMDILPFYVTRAGGQVVVIPVFNHDLSDGIQRGSCLGRRFKRNIRLELAPCKMAFS